MSAGDPRPWAPTHDFYCHCVTHGTLAAKRCSLSCTRLYGSEPPLQPRRCHVAARESQPSDSRRSPLNSHVHAHSWVPPLRAWLWWPTPLCLLPFRCRLGITARRARLNMNFLRPSFELFWNLSLLSPLPKLEIMKAPFLVVLERELVMATFSSCLRTWAYRSSWYVKVLEWLERGRSKFKFQNMGLLMHPLESFWKLNLLRPLSKPSLN